MKISVGHTLAEFAYSGIVTFMTKILGFIQVPVFLLIHNLTDFNPEEINQSNLAIFGINIHLAIIPAVVVIGFGLLGYFVFNMKTKSPKQ